MRVWSIGHSTRSLEEFVGALRAYGIEALADVRSFPRSARHPQFNEETLARELPQVGIAYAWLGTELGGRRKRSLRETSHTALRVEGFRNYADHMETDAFKRGVETLLALAGQKTTAYMCAERLWWRCHRSFLSDYLSAIAGVEVIHIHDERKTEPHRLHRTARVAPPTAGLAAGQLIYDVGETSKLALE